MTVRVSISGEQWLSIMRLCEHQSLCTYMESPPPLLLPESLLWSWRCIVRSASCTAASGIAGCSQVSVIIITQQSQTELLAAISSSISSILCAMDLALERNMLGSGGLWGCLLSLASRPAWHPRFCFLSLRRLRHLKRVQRLLEKLRKYFQTWTPPRSSPRSSAS